MHPVPWLMGLAATNKGTSNYSGPPSFLEPAVEVVGCYNTANFVTWLQLRNGANPHQLSWQHSPLSVQLYFCAHLHAMYHALHGLTFGSLVVRLQLVVPRGACSARGCHKLHQRLHCSSFPPCAFSLLLTVQPFTTIPGSCPSV